MGPPDASSSSYFSMAALYVRNRRRAKYGKIPLSAGEIEYLSRKDEAARRRQRLLEVRNHEKRVAQLVTQRYRDNLRRLHAHKLRGAQQAHQLQKEALLGELHAKYQLSLQNVGSAHRQAREMLAELVEDARIEQGKWAYNEARVVRVRSGEASKLHDEEKEAEIARRKEVEDSLQRLKETSMKQRAQASIHARREQEMQIEMARRQEEAARFRRQTVKEEVFTMSRPRAKDVDAYQFTRLHCVSAPAVPTTALKPHPEVKVIRHNRAHPSTANGIDEARKYRDEMDKKWEQDRNLREQNVEKAEQRGDHALEHVKSVKDGQKAIEWLQRLDKAQRYEQTVDYVHDFQNDDHAAGKEPTPQANDKAAEEAFLRMFAIHDERLELSTHSVRTEEGFSPVSRVAASPLYHRNQRRVFVDPVAADMDWDEGYESFTSSQRDSHEQNRGQEGATSAAFNRKCDVEIGQMNGQVAAKPSAFSSGKEDSADDVMQPSKGLTAFESTENSWIQQKHEHEAGNSRHQVKEPHQQSPQQQQQAARDQEMQSRRERQPPEGAGGNSIDESFTLWGSERSGGDYHNLVNASQNEQLQKADLGELHQRRESLDALESRLKDVLSFRQHRRDGESPQPSSRDAGQHTQTGDRDAADMNKDGRLSRDDKGNWMQQSDLNAHSEERNELHQRQHDTNDGDRLSFHSHMASEQVRGVRIRQWDEVDGEESRHSHGVNEIGQRSSDHRGSWTPQSRFSAKAHQRSERQQFQRDAVEEEHFSHHSSMDREMTEQTDTFQLRQRDQGGEIGEESPSLRSSLSSRRHEHRSSLQPQQRDGSEESASLRSFVTSSRRSEKRVGYQSRQHDQAIDAHASMCPSVSSFINEKRNDTQLQHRDDEVDEHSRRRSSVVSTRSETRVEHRLHGKGESGESHRSLDSSASSIHFQLQHREETEDEHVSLHSSVSSSRSAMRSDVKVQQRESKTQQEQIGFDSSVSSTESGRRRDYQLQQRHELQEERASLRSSGSSNKRASSRSSVLLHQGTGNGEDLLDQYLSASSKSSQPSHQLHLRYEAEEVAELHSSKSSTSSRRTYSPRPENGPRIQPRQFDSESLAQAQLLNENEEIFVSSGSSHRDDNPRRDNQSSMHQPSQYVSESTVLPQLLSENEDSFDGSVSLGSVDTTGDRGHLYIQKIHERLQGFSGRSSTSSSVAQYSLPLSESMSSINESFNDHLPGYGDDSFIHKLVPMFPTPSGMLAIEQANEEGDLELQEQYDVQLADPALSRMLGDSVYSRKSAQASNLTSATDARDVRKEIEPRERRSEQSSFGEHEGAEMEQQSLLSDSGSGMSSVGFSALLHLTAGTSRQLLKSDIVSRVDADDALENEEKGERDLDHSRRSSSSDSSLSVDARFNYLVSMTAAARESLPLHIRLPAMIYGNKDMSAPPRPIKWAASPSSSSSSGVSAVGREEGSPVIKRSNQQAQQPANLNDDEEDDEHDSDRSDNKQLSERSSSSSRVKGESSSNGSSTLRAGAGVQAQMPTEKERHNSSSRHSDESEEALHKSDDEMQYEAFRRGLMEGKMGSLPPPPFGNIDMSRPPPPLTSLQQSGSQSSHSRSSISSRHSNNSGRGRFDRSRAERDLGKEEKQEEESLDDGRSSLFLEANRPISRRDRSRRGESMFISISASADDREDDEERKEEEGQEESSAVSLADAFRQRHPRFHRRVEENREQQKQKRQELQSLQQQDKENTRKPNVGSTNRKQGKEALPAAASGGDAADLTIEQQRLLDRLAFGERAQVSSQEMKERTKRLYQKLPEVVERKRQEETLRRRKERLAELREQEKARRLQQKQRREQQKRHDEASN